jgi:hypothetical protein
MTIRRREPSRLLPKGLVTFLLGNGSHPREVAMNTRPFQLLKPLKVIPLGLENKTRRYELPGGSEVRILRESVGDDCIDLAYKNERYFTLRNEVNRT